MCQYSGYQRLNATCSLLGAEVELARTLACEHLTHYHDGIDVCLLHYL